MNISSKVQEYLLTDETRRLEIEQGLRQTYFTSYEPGFLETELGQEDLKANVYRRYNASLTSVVPWVARHIDLVDKEVVEIGCGNGSSTAAFAPFVSSIKGYDIDKPSVDGARKRLDILGITNADVQLITAEQLIPELYNNHSKGIDIALLFAVLEHQTVHERIETIQTCWKLLRPGGILVVAETPNLLQYFDSHTSLLPFQHFLPTDLYVRYVVNSPRNGFNTSFNKIEDQSFSNLDLVITRWGRGVSYHDFELALGPDYGKYIVANGYEKEMLEWVGVTLEEEVLRYYVEQKGFEIPSAFTRSAINVIFVKSETCEATDNANIPQYNFIASAEDYHNTQNENNILHQKLAITEQHLTDILNSKRWKMAELISKPYRFLKSKFKHQ